MGWLKSVTGAVTKGLGLADQAILDKDLVIKLAAANGMKELDAYIRAVSVKTVPLIDGLHKMSRVMMFFSVIGLAIAESVYMVEVSRGAWQAIMLLGGGYTFMKGKGK